MSLNLRGSNQYFDAEAGLHHNLHRYFDSDAGRYLTPDPSGQAGWVTALASATGAIAFAIVAYDIVAGIINAAIQVNNAKCVRGLRLIGEKLAKQVSDGLTTGLVGLLVGGAAAKVGRGPGYSEARYLATVAVYYEIRKLWDASKGNAGLRNIFGMSKSQLISSGTELLNHLSCNIRGGWGAWRSERIRPATPFKLS